MVRSALRLASGSKRPGPAAVRRPMARDGLAPGGQDLGVAADEHAGSNSRGNCPACGTESGLAGHLGERLECGPHDERKFRPGRARAATGITAQESTSFWK